MEASLQTSGKLLLTHKSERSVLRWWRRWRLQPFVVAKRKRYATCSGVSWIDDRHLAVVNLYGGHCRIYRFHYSGIHPETSAASAGPNEGPARLEQLHEESQGIAFPEDVAASPNGKFLAITSSMTKEHGISLHALDSKTLRPGPPLWMQHDEMGYHGVGFSPDSRFFAFTHIGNPGFVEVRDATTSPPQRTCFYENPYQPLKPKSVAFSSDQKFVAVAFARNISPTQQEGDDSGKLEIYRFDATNGEILQPPIATINGSGIPVGTPEIVDFGSGQSSLSYRLYLTNQGFDVAEMYDFDGETEHLEFVGLFARDLNFPHGLAISPNGQLAAITNYGDDSLRIFGCPSLERPEGRTE